MALPDIRFRVTHHSTILDSSRRYLTDTPTPEKFAATLKATDTGDVAAAVELNNEMEAKDAHLQGVANTRRLALTALPYDVIPDEGAADQEAAGLAADFVREEIRTILNWDDGIDHLATAIGPGVAVLENIWNHGRLVEVVPVPGHRLMGDMIDGSGVFIETDANMVDGVDTTQPKFVRFTPHARAGFPFAVTITRAQAWLWMLKHFSIADWAAFNETYGQPVRVGTFKTGATPEEQADLKSMLENMGPDLWAMFSDKVEFKMLEAGRGNEPYSKKIEWIERKQSILYLGQTLTTEVGSTGSLALGNVHDSVRTALTLSDMKNEAMAVQNKMFRWMVRFRWPNQKMPTPLFRRQPMESRNLDADRLELDKLRYMDERGLPVDTEVIYDRLGIPQPKQQEESVTVE